MQIIIYAIQIPTIWNIYYCKYGIYKYSTENSCEDTAQKMNFSIKDFFSKYDQFLQ